MRKIIMNLAMSLDGYICDENGGFDWIVGHGDNDGKEPYDFASFMTSVDTLVMGKISFEDVILSGLSRFDDHKILVASHEKLEVLENVEIISGDIVNQIVKMKEEKGKNIWLFGGAGLIDAFIRANAVDEYVIAIIPTILGNGRRLFKGDYQKLLLHLDDYSIGDGILVMTYSRR